MRIHSWRLATGVVALLAAGGMLLRPAGTTTEAAAPVTGPATGVAVATPEGSGPGDLAGTTPGDHAVGIGSADTPTVDTAPQPDAAPRLVSTGVPVRDPAAAVADAFAEAEVPPEPPQPVDVVIVREVDGLRTVDVTRAETAAVATAAVAGAVATAPVVSVGLDTVVHAETVVDRIDQWQMNPSEYAFAAAWGTATGRGVIVAVIDSGVRPDHEDLPAARVLTGVEMIGGTGKVTAANGHADQHGHGTAVAGVIAATRGNGLGIAGAAPEATILPVRVLGPTGSGSSADVAAGIYHAVANGAKVINLSLGSSSPSSLLRDAIDYAVANDVVVVTAAGNAGAETVSYPAAYPSAIAVGAVGTRYALASFSSYSTKTPYVDLVAPGVSTATLTSNRSPRGASGPYAIVSGTSFAAPHVAAAAALVRSAQPRLTAGQVRAALEGGALDVDVAGTDPRTGRGALRPDRALTAAASTATTPSTSTTTTTTRPSTTTTAPTTTTQRPATSTTTTTRPSTTTTAPTTTLPGAGAPTAKYVPTAPQRVETTLRPGTTATLQLGGRSGVPAGATAVTVTITALTPDGTGTILAGPAGGGEGLDALTVAERGRTVSTFVTVPLGTNGRISLTSTLVTRVTLDLSGWFVPATTSAGGRYVPLAPAVLLDTRAGSPIAARALRPFAVAGTGGVPRTGVHAVVVRTQASSTTAATVQLLPTGNSTYGPGTATTASTAPGAPASALAIVPLGTGGTISAYASAPVHLVVEVLGYITDATAPVARSGLFVAIGPTKVLDTRASSHLTAGVTASFAVAGANGIPTSGVLGVTGSVTALAPSGAGELVSRGTGEARVPMLTLAPPVATSAAPFVERLDVGRLLVQSSTAVHLTAKVSGYFVA
jgi:serine protease